MMVFRNRFLLLALGLALAAAACGGNGEDGPAASGDGGLSSGLGVDPPGGKIAFVSFRDGNQEIYVINPDGSDERNLTNDPATDFNPDWSPDGETIAFVSDRQGQPHIFLMDGDGSNVRQLTRDRLGSLAPRWSSNGKKIAFSQAGSLAVMDADGSNVRVIMEAEPEMTADACRAGSYPGGWSPNDQTITYYAASISRQVGQVCSIDVGGSEIEVVVAEPETYVVEPVWSSDGRYIAFRAITEGVHDIWVLDLETGEKTNITNDADLDIEPAWSPDGEWIVFGALREMEPNMDLFIMRRDGSGVRRLTDDAAKEAYPAWAP